MLERFTSKFYLFTLSNSLISQRLLNRLFTISKNPPFASLYSSARKNQNYHVDFYDSSNSDANQISSSKRMRWPENYWNSSETYKAKGHFQNVYSMLKNNADIPLHALVYLPKTAHSINRQRDFANEVLTLWWHQLEPKLISRRVYCSDAIKGTFFGLYKVNIALNGCLSASFEWSRLEVIIDYILGSVLNVSPRNFNQFLKCLSSLVKTYPLSSKQTEEFTRKLNDAFNVYVNGVLDQSVLHSEQAAFDMCQIVFRLNVNLGFTTLSDDCLLKLIKIYSQILDEHHFRSSFDFLKSLHYMAVPFINWNIDPCLHDKKFWTVWYSNVYKYYQTFSFSTNEGVFHAFCLMDCIKVAMKFDQEVEFLKCLSLWIDGVRLNRRFISNENCSAIREQIHDKYLNYEYCGIVDEVTVNSLLECLK